MIVNKLFRKEIHLEIFIMETIDHDAFHSNQIIEQLQMTKGRNGHITMGMLAMKFQRMHNGEVIDLCDIFPSNE